MIGWCAAATLSNFLEKMLYFESLPLLTIEEPDSSDPETWLYVVKIKCQETPDVGPTIEEEALLVMNSTINLKETSQWLENINPEDVLLRDIKPCFLSEALPENDKSEKIIDTRTFTRPRKSPLRPVSIRETVETQSSNLNSTFNFKAAKSSGKSFEILNSTVVFEEDEKSGKSDMNATFQIENEESSPCNNNVYPLNSTFPTEISNGNSVVMNTTYQHPPEEDLAAAETPPPPEFADEEEAVFRKPLLPGAVPKKTLMRTSTLNSESPIKNGSSFISQTIDVNDMETNARLQEESLAHTSTPVGQRKISVLNRTGVIEPNLGSPISSLSESNPVDLTVDYDQPIQMNEFIINNSLPDNSSTKIRGHLTFEKSQNSFDMQSSTPTSPAGSPYSSQSLESDTGVPISTQDLIRRSMPNLNNSIRMRLAQPTASVGNLNRQHGSQSGLRPPAVLKSAIRPQIGSRVNGTSLIRPQSQLKAPLSQSGHIAKVTMEAPAVSTVLQTGLQRLATVGSIPTSSRNSMLPGLSRLKAPSCGVLKSSVTNVSSSIIPTNSFSKKVDMNATIVVEKPLAANAAESRPSSGIPRPSMSKIPGPRTKSSIPTMAFRQRTPQ